MHRSEEEYWKKKCMAGVDVDDGDDDVLLWIW